MDTIVRSALFVDFDNIFFGLRHTDNSAAKAFANDPAAWLDAIISGALIELADGETAPARRILVRRCYANPQVMRYFRSAFLRTGFQIIDCPSLTARGKNSADISMVIDTLETLDHPTRFDEFIILSGDADFTPLISRLRAHDRRTVIYSNAVTASAYRAICDGMVTEESLIACLTGEAEEAEAPAEIPRRPGPAPERRGGDTPSRRARGDAPQPAAPPRRETTSRPAPRPVAPPAVPEEVERVARRVARATGAPLIPPLDYAALFRALAAELSEHGYSFRGTTDAVLARLEQQGLRLSAPAVAFVLKGLTLADQPLTGEETAAMLARSFRRQVHAIAASRNLDLTDRDRLMVGAWIIGGLKSVPQAEVIDESDEPSDEEIAAEAALDDAVEDDDAIDLDAEMEDDGEEADAAQEEDEDSEAAPEDEPQGGQRQKPRVRSPADVTDLLARIRSGGRSGP